jgi:peptidyl-prolyl cis-trans isomerase SurA
MVEPFEEAAFSLEQVGDLAGPVRTNYGFHVLKLIDKKELPSFEDSQRELTKKVRRDSRAEITKTSFVRGLQAEYGAKVSTRHRDALVRAASNVDSLFHAGHPLTGVKSSELSRTLFNVAGQAHTVGDFVEWVNASRVRNLDLPSSDKVKQEIDRYLETMLLAHEDTQLERKHSDFRLLMEEYHDGILLFELTDQNVWSRAVKDTAGLVAYHEAHPEDFMWDDRLDVAIYTCEDADIAKKVRKALRKSGDVETLRRELIAERPLALRAETGMFSQGENEWADRAFTALSDRTLVADKKGMLMLETSEGGSQIILVEVKAQLAPTPKALDECRGQAIAAYQDHLEQAWIEELRMKYPHDINREALYSLVRK